MSEKLDKPKNTTLEQRFGICPYATAQSLISGTWAILILHDLQNGPLRFNELQRQMPAMTHAAQVMQNRGVMMIFIPIAIQACKSMGANPVGVIIMVRAARLTAFMTPMATPAVPMIMAEGGYNFNDMLKQSVIPAVIFCAVTVLWTCTVFPLF